MNALVQNKLKWVSWSNLSVAKNTSEQGNKGMLLFTVIPTLKENMIDCP